MPYDINVDGKVYRVDLKKMPATGHQDHWICRLDGREISVDAVQLGSNTLSLVLDGKSFEIQRESAGEAHRLFIRGRQYDVTVEDARSLKGRKRSAADNAGPIKLTAAMPGKVIRVLAKEGDTLQAGMGILVVEAMKMQNELRSPKDGRLKQMLARHGMNVNAGDVLAVLE
jgi:biotin carboxyl carrier protein